MTTFAEYGPELADNGGIAEFTVSGGEAIYKLTAPPPETKPVGKVPPLKVVYLCVGQSEDLHPDVIRALDRRLGITSVYNPDA